MGALPMGTFSIWHWVMVILLFVWPAIFVATERTHKTMTRLEFICWVLGFLLFGLAIYGLQVAIGPGASSINIFLLIVNFGIAIALYRFIVRRCRDAGHGKTLAYVAVIPLVNLVVILYLMIKGQKKDTPTGG